MTRFLIFSALIAFFFWSWRGAASPQSTARRKEAARLLGVDLEANSHEIIEAHKRLIAKVHPDAGGSAELAAQVNLARDVLLGKAPR
jgi:hypothetical protein